MSIKINRRGREAINGRGKDEKDLQNKFIFIFLNLVLWASKNRDSLKPSEKFRGK